MSAYNTNGRNVALPDAFLLRASNREKISIDRPDFKIGKDRNQVNYVIENNSISRFHATIISDNGHFFVRDNNSTNNTYVNNAVIPFNHNVELFDGDIICFANEMFEFHIHNNDNGRILCRGCNAEIPADSVFCPNCGVSVGGQVNPQPQPAYNAYAQPYTPPMQNNFAQQGAYQGANAGYAPEPVGLIECYKRFLQKAFEFNGRSRRSDYWYPILMNFIIGFGVGLLSWIPILNFILIGAWGIYCIINFIAGVAVIVRRLHDIGKSGAYFFMMLIPLAGPFIILAFMCQDSQPGVNQYGPNPKGM